MTISSLYLAAPLPDHNSIRVLRLQPATLHNDALRCKLEVCSLEGATNKFEAISYVWGVPVFPHTLHCGNDSYLKITENLYAALKALRKTDSDRLLWADAICIDQDNVSEKSQQVNLMSKIYGAASRTLVWLGDEDETTHLAFDLCEHLSANKNAYGLRTIYPFQDGWINDPDEDRNRRELEQDLVHGPALGALLSRSWFWRRWMIQEVALGKEVKICCGRQELRWDVLAAALAVIRLVEQTRIPGEGEGWIANAHQQRLHFWESGWAIAARRLRIEHNASARRAGGNHLTNPPSTMLEVLSAASFFECSDPRDYIFALSAVVDDIRFDSNYAELDGQTYTRLAHTYLYDRQNPRPIRILHHASLPTKGVNSNLQASIPSYVPNWQLWANVRRPRFGGSGSFKFGSGFREPAQVAQGLSGSPLICGYHFDHIEYVGLEPTNETALSHELKAWYRGYCQGSMNVNQYLTGEHILTAMARTLLADNQLRVTRQRLDARTMKSLYEAFAACLSALVNDASLPGLIDTALATQDSKPLPNGAKYIAAALQLLPGRCLAVTRDHRVGLMPAATIAGDEVVIFAGAETPFILRRTHVDGRQCFQIVGECYVHGLMYESEVKIGRFGKIMCELV